MGISYRFQEGKVLVNHNKFLGYTKDKQGQLVIVPEDFNEGEYQGKLAWAVDEEKVENKIADVLEM